MASTDLDRSPRPSAPLGRFLPVLLLLFVGSGCAALIYEVVWLSMLQLVIGSAAVSLGVLLGTFMGGMCLGSWLLPRVVSARRHPLRVYAALEVGIGLFGLLLAHGMPLVERVYAASAGGGWVASLALRAAVCILCLLPPTVLMGATLPAIARWIQTTREGVSWLGFFYGGNIAGAVAGSLAAGFYLLRLYDMVTASYVAVAINVLVSIIGLALSAAGRERPAPAVASDPPSPNPVPGAPVRVPQSEFRLLPARRTIYVAIALSGLTALGAEVVWTRLLSLLLGPTVYTFSLILAVFLFGLGLGSGAGSFLGRRVEPRVALGYCQVILGAAIAWTAYALAESLPYWPVNPELTLSPTFMFQTDLARSVWAVLPGALLWGASFPLALAAAATPGQDPGRLVGGVYAANTVGAILGALLFSLLLVPALGTVWSQRALLALSAVSAVIVLAGALLTKRRGFAVAGLAVVLVATPFLAWRVSPMPWGTVCFGRYGATWFPELYPGVLSTSELELLKQAARWRVNLHLSGEEVEWEPKTGGEAGRTLKTALEPTVAPWLLTHRAALVRVLRAGRRPAGDAPSSLALAGGDPTRYCTYLGEGVSTSVAVTESSDGYRYFHGAGKVQASTDPRDMRLQRMLGHIPILTRRDPDSVKSVLVVACGAGVTAGSVVPYDTVQRIVICDIEPLVPKHVAPQFAAENYNVVADPRTQVVLDDGRHFVRTTRERFDVITSDPIDPWVKGCAALNTREYYEMCKARLNPGGAMALWLPLYESNFETAKTAIATFFQVFADGVIWSNDSSGAGYDIVLFGQVPPVEKISLDRLHDWLERHPKVRQSLEDVGFGAPLAGSSDNASGYETAVDLLATYAGQERDLTDWTRGAQINLDRNLRLQYLAGLSLNCDLSKAIFDDILLHYRFPANLIEGSEARLSALRTVLKDAGRREPRAASRP